MAYKFQLGAAKLSGSIEQTDGDFLTAKTEFRIGSAQLTEVELEKLDGITNGTVLANKAVVVDGNKDATSFRNIGATQLSASAKLLAGGDITGSGGIQVIDASGLAGTALEDDTTGKLTISAGSVTNGMLAGAIANAKLASSAISIAGTSTSLGGAISAATIAAAVDGEDMAITGLTDLDVKSAGNITILDTVGANTLTVGASNTNVTIAGNLTVNGTTTTVNSTSIEITGSFVFDGTSPGGSKTTFGVVNPTSARAVNLADSAGTLVPFAVAPAAAVQITATPTNLNLLGSGAGSSVALAPGDGVIMFDANDSNNPKKVLMSDISTFVGNAVTTTVQTINSQNHTLDVTAGQIAVCNRAGGVTLTLDSAGNMDGVKMLIKLLHRIISKLCQDFSWKGWAYAQPFFYLH